MPFNPTTGLDFTPAVGDMPFTPLQREWLAKAHALGRDKFAARAAQWDKEASFPFANYEDLREQGFLKLCGATALTWNMHICSTMWTGVLADGIAMTDEQRAEHAARRKLHFARIVDE